MTVFDRLRERIRRTESLLAVGLNPDRSRLPDDCREYDYPRRAFARRIVDATHDYAAAYAVNPAYYADADGWTALAETVAYARGRGVPVVLDGKYADLPNPDADLLGRADAVTVSPYCGRAALRSALDADCGVFVVCRTPNPGAADLQDRAIATDGDEAEVRDENRGGGDADRGDAGGNDDETEGSDEAEADHAPTVADYVADLAASWAADASPADAVSADVGLLVGGSSDDLDHLRERAPDLPFLAVGGAKNDPEIAASVTPEGGPHAGVGLVEATREVLYAGETAGRGRNRGQDDYAAAAGQAARRLAGQLNRER
ncbi:orotidine-5'-phosphate decarboxylase [Halorussus gelatinilyticus]|uniref:Orotidine-5'-phosphate decarboxylase n=1 Tax=Halorussus gelatinilyticus TaxID=2937524 RepID=A0A8U0ILT6_9EURY|nr:orotidine-5'-phosphate decarboxylase [Halorussus gelatinilyticus]UPW00989.1 orotidine-5'-phosphate decarboxylase [Halorussus gelatinilyticus]